MRRSRVGGASLRFRSGQRGEDSCSFRFRFRTLVPDRRGGAQIEGGTDPRATAASGGRRGACTGHSGVLRCQGFLQRHRVLVSADVTETLGKDPAGPPVDTIFGTQDMQCWNIRVDLKRERLDLPHIQKEFVEL